MAGMNTLQMIKMIPTCDGRNYIEWTRSFNDIPKLTWPFLSKIVFRLERPEPILRDNRRAEENASNFYDNDSNRSSDEEPNNSDDLEAWDKTNEHLLSVLRLTIAGAGRSVQLTFKSRNGRPENDRKAWPALKNKYQNTSRQRRRTLLRQLDNSVMRSKIDPDMFFLEVFQLRDELSDLGGETVTDERLTPIILDVLPQEM